MQLTRSAGLVLHATSLPSGKLDAEAYAFVDWLAAAGLSWWQLLPLTPPDSTGSPYCSDSAFAAWTGLLAEPDAPVSEADLDSFRARHAYWIDDWEQFAGPDAVAKLRFPALLYPVHIVSRLAIILELAHATLQDGSAHLERVHASFSRHSP